LPNLKLRLVFKKILKFDKLVYLVSQYKPQILLLVHRMTFKFYLHLYIFNFSIGLILPVSLYTQVSPINRKPVVDRHILLVTKPDSLSSLSVGNGKFCFTVDPTGLQSFPQNYVNGVPLGTQSSWGWHSFPNGQFFAFEETFKEYDFNGKKINYSVQGHSNDRQNQVVDYFRSNPHRLQLANIGFEFGDNSNLIHDVAELNNIRQSLNLWTGTIQSNYAVGGSPVQVHTVAHPDHDLIALKLKSSLLESKKIKLRIRLPSPSGLWKDPGNQWRAVTSYHSTYTVYPHGVDIRYQLDTNAYVIQLRWKGKGSFSEKSRNYYVFQPESVRDFECAIRFVPVIENQDLPSFSQTLLASKKHWKSFWLSGGAIDFAGSKDPRAFELERRVILSQYLSRIQCVSDQPP